MAPEKKRLGKKHRLAQTRPHKGATPKGAKGSEKSVGGASPKGRKTISAKKSAAFTKAKVRTQSPDRVKGRAVTGAQIAETDKVVNRPSVANAAWVPSVRTSWAISQGPA